MTLRRARTVDEYVEWVRQAVFEAEDLHGCLGCEIEDMATFPAYRSARNRRQGRLRVDEGGSLRLRLRGSAAHGLGRQVCGSDSIPYPAQAD